MRRRSIGQGLRLGVVTGILVIWVFPIVWALVTSFKDRRDIFTIPPVLLFTPTLDNYILALTTRPILAHLRDSLIIAGLTTALALLLGVPGGYAFARLRFPLSRPLAFLLLALRMVPLLGFILPLFLLLTWLRWTDTYQGLVLANLSVTLVAATWLMITYFQDLPHELEEAAAVDGASRWQTFLWVMLPQARGGVAVTAVLTFVAVWNEFFFAVVLSGSRVRPITVGMYGFLQFDESLWGPLMATAVMAMGPVVLVTLLAQRHLVRGLTLGAVK